MKKGALPNNSVTARKKLSRNEAIMDLDLVIIRFVGWAVTFASVDVSTARDSSKGASASMMKILRRSCC